MIRLLPLILLLGASPMPDPQFTIERPQMLGGRPVGGQLPTVNAIVDGHPGIFLFDTGASDNVLSPRFAAALGLAGGAAVAGRDSGGNAMAGNVVEQVDVAIGSVRRRLARLVVVPIGALDALGLDGVLSPQSLAGADCLRMDFGKGIAKLVPPASPECSLDGTPAPIARDRRPYVNVTAPGGGAAPFLLDSGAWRTTLPADFAVAAPRLGSEAHGGIAGTVTASDLVGPLTLAIGGRPVRLDSARRAAPGKTGVLGFDLLSRAILVVRPGKDALLSLAP